MSIDNILYGRPVRRLPAGAGGIGPAGIKKSRGQDTSWTVAGAAAAETPIKHQSGHEMTKLTERTWFSPFLFE